MTPNSCPNPSLYVGADRDPASLELPSLERARRADASLDRLALAQHCAQQAEALQQLTATNQALEDQLAYYRQLEDQLQTAEAAIVQSEKMATLGELLAGVAHEINTPLGAIQASAENLSYTIGRSLQQIPQLCRSLSPEQLDAFELLLGWAHPGPASRSPREERQLRRQLKAQLSHLAIAGIAEQTTEVASILSQLGIDQDLTPLLPLLSSPQALFILDVVYNLSTTQANSCNIQLAIERAVPIVNSLRSYARRNAIAKPSLACLAEGIDRVLVLHQNQTKHGIEVERQYGDIPQLLCYREELDQVWSNLIGNAIQAMEGRGKLTVQLAQEAEDIVVAITDSGPGIPKELQGKIFQTFFTTKPMGQGSGLGLAIAQKIISRHCGLIEVESQPGQTTFRVRLPLSSVPVPQVSPLQAIAPALPLPSSLPGRPLASSMPSPPVALPEQTHDPISETPAHA